MEGSWAQGKPHGWIQLGSTEGMGQDVSLGSRVVLTGRPGGPRGPTGPGGPCSPRSPGSPCRERRWWSTRQQGTHLPQPALGAGSVTGSGTVLGTGEGLVALPWTKKHGTGHWSLTSLMAPAGAQPKPALSRGTYISARISLLSRVPLQTRRR